MAKRSQSSDGVPRARRSGLVALAEQLGGRALGMEVAKAVDDPHGYLAEFAERMADINVDAPREDLGWLAITEGLTAREVALEFDWKHEARDGLAQLERLAGRAGKKALARCHDDPELDERPFHEALELFGQVLAGAGRALLHLDKLSDSYVVTVVDAYKASDLVALAKKAGGVLAHIDGSGLAAFEEERRKTTAKRKRKDASTNRWTKLVQASTEQTTEDVLWQLRHQASIDAIREAMPDAPAKERPLIEMVVALHGDPAKTARFTKDPATCLRALRYLDDVTVDPSHWLAAAATIAGRLKIKPGTSKEALHLCEGINLMVDDAAADRGLATLTESPRAVLARIADGVLAGAKYQSEAWDIALRALRTVGDELSLPGLEAARAKAQKVFPDEEEFEDLDEAIARIRKRAKPTKKKR